MTLPEAIQILLVHQAWRLGADIEMAEPKVITEALDVLLNYHTETTPISDEKIQKAMDAYFHKTDINARWGWKVACEWYREQLKK